LNRRDFQRLALVRLDEARVLLEAEKFEGSYYLSGYVVECALKACIAKKTQRHDFPDKALTNSSYSHELTTLLRCADLDALLELEFSKRPQLESN
jgi:HEPN domain-containing protein